MLTQSWKGQQISKVMVDHILLTSRSLSYSSDSEARKLPQPLPHTVVSHICETCHQLLGYWCPVLQMLTSVLSGVPENTAEGR